jgi:D-alanyl-D-alanine carboxypeptidase
MFDTNSSSQWLNQDFLSTQIGNFDLAKNPLESGFDWNHLSSCTGNSIVSDTANETLLGSTENDWLLGLSGGHYLNGKQGDDRLFEFINGDNTLVGGSGNDRLYINVGNNTLKGGSGDDWLWGGTGNDRLEGSAERDILNAGDGNDTLIDVDGGDRLAGGAGSDRFEIYQGELGATQYFSVKTRSPLAHATLLNGGQERTQVAPLKKGGTKPPFQGGWGIFKILLLLTEMYWGTTLITDFHPEADKLKFDRLGITFDRLTFKEQDSRSTVIQFQGQNLAELLSVQPSELTPNNFLFGNAELANTLQITLNQTLSTTVSPGATVAVRTPDGYLWAGASGLSNIETHTTMSANDRFNIASVTKTFTGVTVMQLVESGRLSLDDTMTQWLSKSITDNIPNSDQITIRQLLSMTSGIYNADPFTNTPETGAYYQDLFKDPSLIFLNQTPEAFLTKYVYGRQPAFAPGTSFDYNNSNYRLLGLIIESATGSTLAEAYRDQIIEPLGLKNTFLAGVENIPGGYNPGYTDLNQDGQLENLGAASLLESGASGGLISNVEDLRRFAQGLFNGELLSPAAFNELITGSGIPGFGLGIAYADTPEQGRIYITNGTGFGVQTQLLYSERTGATGVVITNGDDNLFDTNNPAATIMGAIVSSALGEATSLFRALPTKLLNLQYQQVRFELLAHR